MNLRPRGPADPPSDGEATGEVQLVTGSVPVVTSVPPGDSNSTGQTPAIRVVRSGKRFQLPSIALLVVAAIVSALVVSQLRGGPDKFRQQLNTESEGDLTRILASLSSEATSLQQELSSLKVDLANARNSSANQDSANEQTNVQLRALQVLSGTTRVTGPGIRIDIEDPNGQVSYAAFVDAVQELRDAGAEALSINGRRIGVSSAFGQRDGAIVLDDVVLPKPYSISAVGPAATMEGGLKIPGGAYDTLRAINGVSVQINRSNNLELPALEHPPSLRAATPVGSKP